ncbi:MAG: VOC family protein [Pseudomonadota bacterium]
MTYGHFVWADLSTYDMAAARADYAALFSWRFHGDGSYDFAVIDRKEVAAIFPMPPQLAEIDMPSFWMSYVHVEDIEETVAKARSHDGAIIEVEPQAFHANGRIALIRDPSGAGFTVYQGPDITPPMGGVGQVAGRYHHVPDITLIEGFYRDLFGWEFSKASDSPWPTFDILHPDGTVVAQAEEVPESVRGKFRYWMPCFTVSSQEESLERLSSINGEVVSELTGGRTLVAGRQGAHCMIRSAGSLDRPRRSGGPSFVGVSSAPLAWKALTGLCCIWLAVFFDLQAFWGVLFLIWTWLALRAGRADFIEPVSRVGQPLMFWALIATWIVLSAWLIVPPLLGR